MTGKRSLMTGWKPKAAIVSPAPTMAPTSQASLRQTCQSDRIRQDLIGHVPASSLYDLRVFDAKGQGDEFAILCALEFVGWLNRDRANPVVHGVNLSLALATTSTASHAARRRSARHATTWSGPAPW